MILGSYYLTLDKDGERGEGKVFRDVDEVMMAYRTGVIELHSKIKVRRELEIDGKIESGIVDTTIGKIIFNNPIPQDLGFIDRSIPENRFKFEVDFLVGKSGLKKIIDKCIKIHGPVRTSVVLDHIKAQGYKYSTKGAITVAVCDAVIPPRKKAIIAEAEKEVDVIRDEFMMGLRSNEERYEEVLRIWEKATNDVTDALQKNLDRYNPIFMMADSGARGSMSQIGQLAGMRGLIANTSGKTIEIPIELTTVKALTSWSTLFHLVVLVKVLPIQLFVQPTQVTLPAVLLMYHRKLLSVKRTAVLQRVLKSLTSKQANQMLSRDSTSVLSEDISLMTSAILTVMFLFQRML